jgi:small conductance mechanosensitive channel
MPELIEVDAQQLHAWFNDNFPWLLVLVVMLVLLYRFSSRVVHGVVRRALLAQVGQVEPGSLEAAELGKRERTLESLVTTILRALLGLLVVTLIIGFFDAWSLLAAAGLFLAALTLAGQPIVLDYLMGVLIIMEGQFFTGDVVAVGAVAGSVEEVGLRRIVVRGPDGTVHSISNGELRIVSNRTRVYAAAEVQVPGIAEKDLDAVLRIMDAVGQEVAEDPAFAESIIEAHSVKYIGGPDDLGITAIMRGKVAASKRWDVATETRKRLARALADADIVLNRRGVWPRDRDGS